MAAREASVWHSYFVTHHTQYTMGLLPDTQNCVLRMRRECRERFPRHRIQMKSLVNDPGMHHGTCVTHVPWCMSRSLTRDGGENVPGIPGACATRNFTYLARGPLACLETGNGKISIELIACINNYIHMELCNVIICPFSNLLNRRRKLGMDEAITKSSPDGHCSNYYKGTFSLLSNGCNSRPACTSIYGYLIFT